MPPSSIYFFIYSTVYECSICWRHKKIPKAARGYFDVFEYYGWGPVGDLLQTGEIRCQPSNDTPEMARSQLLQMVMMAMMTILMLVSYSLQACTT